MSKAKRRFERIFLIILDGVGIGELPDAARFGDVGADTLGHIDKELGLELPALDSLGLGSLLGHPDPEGGIKGAYGKMAELSPGKDTTTGHWELAGLVLEHAFPTYPEGFPPEVVAAFEKAIGREVLFNKPASGTEIIARLGDEHVKTGKPILYTSADSVFQLAAHEGVVPVEELYRYCKIAREQLVPPHNVGRVIARPFEGQAGSYVRTKRRKDYSLEPYGETVLDQLKKAGFESVGVGKISDIF